MCDTDPVNFLGLKGGMTISETATHPRVVLAANTDYRIATIPLARELVDKSKRDKKVSMSVLYLPVLQDRGGLRIVPEPIAETLVAHISECPNGNPLFIGG